MTRRKWVLRKSLLLICPALLLAPTTALACGDDFHSPPVVMLLELALSFFLIYALGVLVAVRVPERWCRRVHSLATWVATTAGGALALSAALMALDILRVRGAALQLLFALAIASIGASLLALSILRIASVLRRPRSDTPGAERL